MAEGFAKRPVELLASFFEATSSKNWIKNLQVKIYWQVSKRERQIRYSELVSLKTFWSYMQESSDHEVLLVWPIAYFPAVVKEYNDGLNFTDHFSTENFILWIAHCKSSYTFLFIFFFTFIMRYESKPTGNWSNSKKLEVALTRLRAEIVFSLFKYFQRHNFHRSQINTRLGTFVYINITNQNHFYKY